MSKQSSNQENNSTDEFENGMDTNTSTNKKKSIKQRLKEQKKKWLDAKGFPDFLESTVKEIIYLTIYFYFGISFDILAKNVQKNPGGLRGQDLDGPPYVGNFSECKTKIDITESLRDPSSFLSKWSFPYKNTVKCNAKANRDRPLYFRAVTWTTNIIAFTYAMGRKILNYFLSGTNDWANILFGPIMILLVLIITPLFSWGTSLVGMFMNIDKLLPSCYMTWWFPFITFLVFLWGFITYPATIIIYQLLSLIYYLILHPTFSKLEINENGEDKITRGIISIVKRIISNSMWFMFVLIIAAMNAYKHLGLAFSIPFIIWIGFILFSKYFVYLLN